MTLKFFIFVRHEYEDTLPYHQDMEHLNSEPIQYPDSEEASSIVYERLEEWLSVRSTRKCTNVIKGLFSEWIHLSNHNF